MHRHCLLLLTAVTLPTLAQETPPPEPRWEGALAANLLFGPTYQGSGQFGLKLRPGFFVRYGRFSFSQGASFVTRNQRDVVRGLGVDLSPPSDRLRIGMGLRMDSGRRESQDDSLRGLGDVPRTVRARITTSWTFDDGWRLAGAWSVDALGRGGGHFGEIGFGRERPLGEQSSWGWGLTATLGGRRYMQSYYGISPEQSAASGYPVYAPGSGLRDVAVFVNARTDLSPRWTLQAGIGASRLAGAAAESPLTERRNGWGMNVGTGWRF